MNSELKNQIYAHISEDWGDSSPESEVCRKIFDYLASRPLSQLKHLTYSSLKRAAQNNPSDATILRAIQYLCGDRTPVLSMHFEFIEGEREYFLDDVEVREAQKTGLLVHPYTGEMIDNFDDKVFMYFTPSPFTFNADSSCAS